MFHGIRIEFNMHYITLLLNHFWSLILIPRDSLQWILYNLIFALIVDPEFSASLFYPVLENCNAFRKKLNNFQININFMVNAAEKRGLSYIEPFYSQNGTIEGFAKRCELWGSTSNNP